MANIRNALRDVGEHTAKILRTAQRGLVHVWVQGNPRPTVAKLNDLLVKRPSLFVATRRWVPVEFWAPSSPIDLEALGKHFGTKLTPRETWQVAVRKYASQVSGKELLDKVSAAIRRPVVKTEDPDRVLQLSVIGSDVGVADLHRGEIVDAEAKVPPAPGPQPRPPV